MKRILGLVMLLSLFSCSCNITVKDNKKKSDEIVVTTVEPSFENPLVIIQFSITGCEWCRKQYPNFVQMMDKYPDIDFFGVNVDTDTVSREKYDLVSFPTTIFFINGEEYNRCRGYTDCDIFEYLIDDMVENEL
jgi:thioredoxin 1